MNTNAKQNIAPPSPPNYLQLVAIYLGSIILLHTQYQVDI